VLVACVGAAMLSQAGLGDEPAFHVPTAVPFQFGELPACVAVGLLCGLAAALLAAASRSTSDAFVSLRATGVPTAAMPVLGGLACGSLALVCPEITYQGFENVNALLQLTETPAQGYTVPSLAAVIAFKIVASATCRSSGLVGGVYAPSIFIGAAVGAAFWLAAAAPVASGGFALSSPEMYSLVGAAAMLAAFCRVPLTATLLLFELTRDYSVILPTLAAVGFARWSSAAAGRYLR
jgi:H+/Cl- antiporter ClcA